MVIHVLKKIKIIKYLLLKVLSSRAESIVLDIKKYLNMHDILLDIGSGTCHICDNLLRSGYNITAMDVQNISLINSIKPVLYGGETIPFGDNSFDKSLIVTVLHHTKNPEQVVTEAKRVSKSLVIMEDIYTNTFSKYFTYFFDSLLNLEFLGHPHTNKSDKEWKALFCKLDLKLLDVKYSRSFIFMKHATYYLQK